MKPPKNAVVYIFLVIALIITVTFWGKGIINSIGNKTDEGNINKKVRPTSLLFNGIIDQPEFSDHPDHTIAEDTVLLRAYNRKSKRLVGEYMESYLKVLYADTSWDRLELIAPIDSVTFVFKSQVAKPVKGNAYIVEGRWKVIVDRIKANPITVSK